ncbi:PTS transporter subunit EIIC [Lacticaseibacillus daqingensis]|uniref:PTS transporter subunit EIIC n=1 Tax=Lacticaseibacillus daqingensis TaxID=2486014 RepID=UPI000F7B3447|nr:PTS transporter subunit EIIC [Lacticaseibacillus daqingensis]
MEKYEEIGKQLIDEMGGLSNVQSVARCYTRLRLRIKDDSKVQLEKISKLDGVVQATSSDGKLQVVMPEYLDKIYNYMSEQMGGAPTTTTSSEPAPKEPWTPKRVLNSVLDAISNSLTPMIGGLAMTGLFLALLNLLTVTHVIAQGSQTYILLHMMGDSLFHFMPFMVAYGAARYFKANPILSLILAGILMHPDFAKLVAAGGAIHLFGLPVAALSYETTLVPILITVWVQSMIEKLFDRPFFNKLGLVKNFPVLLIMGPLSLLVTAPIGETLASYIANGALWVYNQAPIVGITALSLLIPFFIITGSHWVFFPVAFASLKSLGYDPFLWVTFAVWNFAELGMTLAILLKAKKRSTRSLAASSAFSIAASGITEPAVYGLMLKMKKPIIPSVIASGIGGLFFSLLHVKVFSLVTVSLLSLPQFINPNGGNNFVSAIIGAFITVAAGFLLNYFWKFDESMFDDDETEPVTDETVNKNA